MLFSAINTSLHGSCCITLEAYVLFFYICTFLHILDYFYAYLVGKEGQERV